MFVEQQIGKRFIGNNVPKVGAEKNRTLYSALSSCIEEGIVASSQSIHRGGLIVALSKTAMGGMLGMDVSLERLSGSYSRDDFALYSESQGRLVVTVAPQFKKIFEERMQGNIFSQIGTTIGDDHFIIKNKDGKDIVNTNLNLMLESYKSTFRGY